MSDITKAISDQELEEISRAIYIRYGMDFANYEQQSFKRRLGRALQKFGIGSIYELWKIMLRDHHFIYQVIDEITVGLTEMFRNPALWVMLRDQILPPYLRREAKLKIWHAGCSTGEEVYTTAIVLLEANLLYRTEAWATDLSYQAVQTAKEGFYEADVFAKYAANYQTYEPNTTLSKYFYKQKGGWQVFQTLQKHVHFEQQNLVKDNASEVFVQSFDIIFCRNVMIYFDEMLKMRVLEKFYQALQPDGLLIIGYYDALPEAYKDYFETFTDSGNKILKKKNSPKQ